MTKAKSSVSTETAEKITEGLHLPDLVIQGFRGIDDLRVSSLGRVTMITGKNAVGKTSILEAVRILAARGNYVALTNLLRGREELADTSDEDGDSVSGIDLTGLFNGWRVNDSSKITIGSSDLDNQLTIAVADVTDDQLELFGRFNPGVYELGNKMLKVRFNGSDYDLPWIFSFEDFAVPMSYQFDRRFPQLHRRLLHQQTPSEIPCANLGPGLPGNVELADTWGEAIFTDDEENALAALRIVLGDEIVRVAVRGDQGSQSRRYRSTSRFIAGRKNQSRQFPLKAFGDGAFRMLGVALALVRARNGFLLIDEAENGIHYSVQADFWRMVLKAAHENNVQVIATTHSFDCVSGFARAANEVEAVDGALVRLSKHEGKLYADSFSEDEVENAVRYSTDLR